MKKASVYVFMTVCFQGLMRRIRVMTCCCNTRLTSGGFHTCGATCNLTFSTMSVYWPSR